MFFSTSCEGFSLLMTAQSLHSPQCQERQHRSGEPSARLQWEYYYVLAFWVLPIPLKNLDPLKLHNYLSVKTTCCVLYNSLRCICTLYCKPSESCWPTDEELVAFSDSRRNSDHAFLASVAQRDFDQQPAVHWASLVSELHEVGLCTLFGDFFENNRCT